MKKGILFLLMLLLTSCSDDKPVIERADAGINQENNGAAFLEEIVIKM
ncbi:MAG: hypothetical protein ACQEWU_12345 [Bacillota bacterium]|uniref:Uncharacterized protein n=1 Tax=Virgibacillus salarius TaxID=447199 RepID=A0A941DYD5_9BACI|nr:MULTISPECIES: hypothetical protein [Bacillaceae]NAZ09147.1 hypothetical protein [Agaribacter marinus]MBR7796438.1 hypothetical protein [Virgibacillus salarius]MCC2251183.1 hypothetical protein [Virgibacillus sp. AGTR]MDY7045345.1 hypothetical protein [Virgibacillus sp. M23]QRZ16785.1 hypothetical protein JUJ52_13355 [Virgibacillus sp. AGTR]